MEPKRRLKSPFCVPYSMSVYFLKADLNVSDYSGSMIFDTLGCILRHVALFEMRDNVRIK